MNSSTASSSLPGSVAASSPVNPVATRALIIGVVGLAIGIGGLFMGFSNHDARPVIGYLLGFGFWLSMFIGMLMLVILFYLFDAGWAIVVRRQLEHGLAAIPMIALAFVPLLLSILGVFGKGAQGLLWQWLDPSQPLVGGAPGETIGQNPLFLHKAAYLSLPFFLARLAIYLSVFWGLSYVFRKYSFAMDRDPRTEYVIKCRKFAAFGIYAVAMSLTFAAFDLFMSLSYTWYSTMYGVWFFATSMRCGIAGTILICLYQSAKPGRPLYGIFNRAHQYLLGCLALTFTVFYAYVTFCQYFLIYNADVPEETFWYNLRELTSNWTYNSWWWVSLGIIFGYFFLPFFFLLNYHVKVSRKVLPWVAVWVLCFHILDLYFNILPGKIADATATLGYQVREFSISPFDIATLVGIGGLCAYAFLRSQTKAEAIPIHDPRIEESLNYHE